MAQQIVKHPAHPMDFTICWNLGPDCTKAYVLTPGNALMGYVLVPTVLTGAHEWTAHLTQLVLVWIAVLAMTSLVLRFGWDRRHAIAGALLLVAIAPFLPMASTAMPDILAAAVALVAMERLAAWKAEQKWTQGAAAAIALGLAGFARAHLPLLLPLAAFYLLDSTRPEGGFCAGPERDSGYGPRSWQAPACSSRSSPRPANIILASIPLPMSRGYINLGPNLVAYLLYLVIPLPLAACWIANRLRNRSVRAAILLIVAEGMRPVRAVWSTATRHGVRGYWTGCAGRFALRGLGHDGTYQYLPYALDCDSSFHRLLPSPSARSTCFPSCPPSSSSASA